MKKEKNNPGISKIKDKVSIVGSVPKTNYFVAKDGRVFRELKPTRVNDKLYYNLVLGGVLRRVSRVTLEKEASNVQ